MLDDPLSNPRFRPNDILSIGEDGARFVRLAIASRRLVSLVRALNGLRDMPGPDGNEVRYHLFIQMFGAAKEAADAFRDCDAAGHFKWMEKPDSSLAELQAELASVRLLSDRSAPTSFYSRFLKPVRDAASYHLSRSAVAQALAELEDVEYSAFELDENGVVLSSPLLNHVLLRICWGNGRDSMPPVGQELIQFSNVLASVSHDHFRAFLFVLSDDENPGRDDAP